MDTSLLFLVVQNKSVYTKKVRGDAVVRLGRSGGTVLIIIVDQHIFSLIIWDYCFAENSYNLPQSRFPDCSSTAVWPL